MVENATLKNYSVSHPWRRGESSEQEQVLGQSVTQLAQRREPSARDASPIQSDPCRPLLAKTKSPLTGSARRASETPTPTLKAVGFPTSTMHLAAVHLPRRRSGPRRRLGWPAC